MNNTKTIFKSLLIMIVAISLFTVSCSKDEGGTKTPTTPTIKKVSAQSITDILKALVDLKKEGETTVILSLKNINPQGGSAAITDANPSFNKVKEALGNVTSTQQNILEVTDNLSTIIAKPNQVEALNVELTFKAKSGFEFDESITADSATTYTYSAKDKTAKLTLKITPSANWTD